jgi:hypothetical protein
MTRAPRVCVATQRRPRRWFRARQPRRCAQGTLCAASTHSMCGVDALYVRVDDSCPGAAVGSSPADRRLRAGHARGVADVCCDREWSRVPSRSRAGGFRLFVDDLPKETGRPPGLTARIETRGSQRHGRGGPRRRCQSRRRCSGRARAKNVPVEPVWRSRGTFPLHQDGNVPHDRSRKPSGTFPDIPRRTEASTPDGARRQRQSTNVTPRSCAGTRPRAPLGSHRADTAPARGNEPGSARTAPIPPPHQRAESVI